METRKKLKFQKKEIFLILINNNNINQFNMIVNNTDGVVIKLERGLEDGTTGIPGP